LPRSWQDRKDPFHPVAGAAERAFMVALMANRQRARYSFQYGDVFDAEDQMARYVERLSIALGDLRIVANYAVRQRQKPGERLYFVRLMASHLREIVVLLDPPDRRVLPSVEDFLKTLPRGVVPSRAEIRKSHRQAMRMIDKPMKKGRPEILGSNGKLRRPTLRDDLKELRNQFFHYSHLQNGDDALAVAMQSLADERTGYVIRERTMRANYADAVAIKLAHPFEAEFAEDMHARIVELISPVSTFIHRVEAAWFYRHAEKIKIRRPGHPVESLDHALGID
jgi:hypothetical protein